MKKTTLIITTVALIFIMCFNFVACNIDTSNDVTISDNYTEEYKSYRVILNSDTPLTVNENVLTATLTATVLPENLYDKSVDWSVEWHNPGGTFESTHTVTDYVTVTPQSDGSNVATVTAHQPFENTPVIVRVTTRVGGFSDVTMVSYVGKPDTLEINPGNLGVDSNGYYLLGTNTTSLLNIDLSNIFGASTDTYYNEYADLVVDSVAYGGCVVCSKYKFYSGSWQLVSESYDLYYSEIAQNPNYDLYATIVDNQLKLETGMMIESLNESTATIQGTTYKYTYKYTKTAPYITVRVRDNSTGITNTISIVVTSDAQSVTLDNEEILF